ncbi:MAG: hypothetical protein JO257_24680 [Deltaproteobacteria bacterium]|nr:hypothetical protein [Deltaproteobacteria bacterium]
MDFVFMLTRADRTIANWREVLDEIRPLKLTHVGFKDVGIAPDAARELAHALKATGATTYLEVVSTSRETAIQSAQLGRDIGIDRLLGGTDIDAVLPLLEGSTTRYLPFPGKPHDHPTKLGGSAADIAADCARFEAAGCAGVDLLAYRATEAPPLDLVRAARRVMKGTLLVAGSVDGAARVRELEDAGADAFTVGSAAFDLSFAPGKGTLRAQLEAILDAAA